MYIVSNVIAVTIATTHRNSLLDDAVFMNNWGSASTESNDDGQETTLFIVMSKFKFVPQ